MSKIGFCAISGSGMSALAQVSRYMGNDVYGTDRSFDQKKDTKNKQALENLGIKIFPQDGSMLTEDFSALYASTAVEDTVPDIKRAHELNIPIKRRSDLLAEIFSSFPTGIAIGGTSGKSTVTAMIGYILDQAGRQPLVINGALLKNYENQPGIPNVILNKGKICVIEADESDGSIEKYIPSIAVINNISLDHKSLPELQNLFNDFAKRATIGTVINADDINSTCLQKTNPQTKTFGIKNPAADFFAEHITAVSDGTTYVFRETVYKLNLIGAFNVANAMCAVACCSLLNVAPDTSCKILETFLGTKRRLEVLGQTNDITVIDDFAHNPDKVAASVDALKDYAGRLIVMFQPHGFAPMKQTGKDIMKAFANHMAKEDILIIPDIYFIGGTADKTISSADLIKVAQDLGVNAHYIAQRGEVEKFILSQAKAGDRIIIMGARDNTLPDFSRKILGEL